MDINGKRTISFILTPQTRWPNEGIEDKDSTDEQSVEIVIENQQPSFGTNSLAMHYPSALIKRSIFMDKDVSANVLRFLPMKNNLSLANRFLYGLNREFFFFPLLRKIPQVNQQINQQINQKNGKDNLLINIAEEMTLRNESELASYLAKNLNSESKEELIPDAFSMLEYLANEGCPAAQSGLGLLYYFGGKGIEKNYEQALGWFYKAQQKSSEACTYISLMLLNGCGIKSDIKSGIYGAEDCAKKAIKLNPSNHQAHLVMAWVLGANPRRREEAFSFLQKSAELGSLRAVEEMMKTSVEFFFRSGSEIALAMELLDKAICSGQTISKNTFTRFIYEVCADLEFTDGIKEFLLGHLYINGWDRDRPKDVVKGINYFKDAVEKGNEKALLKLCDWYIQTQISTSDNAKDINLLSIKQFIIKHLEKLDKKGWPEARYTLGTVYELDQSEGSQKQASHYFELAVVRNKHKKALEKVRPAMLSRAAKHVENGQYLEACAIYIPLANAGDNEAKQKIAFMFIGKMISNSNVDQKLLRSCLEYLANQGSADAAFELANWHMTVPFIKKSEEAIKWYVNAFYRGRTDASYRLGMLVLAKSSFLFKAALLEAALLEAKKWFELAVKDKIKGANEKLADVNKMLRSK